MAKKKKSKKFFDDDDGRTISNMNVEGMPWYTQKTPKETSKDTTDEQIKLTKREELALMWGVIKASLLVAGIFVAVFTIFILFCIFVWFK